MRRPGEAARASAEKHRRGGRLAASRPANSNNERSGIGKAANPNTGEGSEPSASSSGTKESSGASGETKAPADEATAGAGNSPAVPITESAPTAAAPPVEESSSAPVTRSGPVSFEPGLNSGWEPSDVEAAAQLGSKLVRVDMSIEDTPQELEGIIGAYAAKGIRVLPLADFHGEAPTSADARGLAAWAATFGPTGTFWRIRPSEAQYAVQSIEFGNETSYSYQYSNDTPAGYASRGENYALRFAEAAQAIRGADPAVGLLAQGDPGNSGTVWIHSMFKAVPKLGEFVAGWTIHPYGFHWRERIESMMHQLAHEPASTDIPIDITEWGLATDGGSCLTENYGWNPCMNYMQAAETVTSAVSEMRKLLNGRLQMFLLYQARDERPTGQTNEREAYFGVLQRELQPKGAYTQAVQALLAY